MDTATYVTLTDLFTVALVAMVIGLGVFAVLRRTNPLARWGAAGNVFTSPLRAVDLIPAAGVVLLLSGMISLMGMAEDSDKAERTMGAADVLFGGVIHLMVLSAVVVYLGSFRRVNLPEFFGLRQMKFGKVLGASVGLLLVTYVFVWIANALYATYVLEGRWEDMGKQDVVESFQNGGLGLKLSIAVTAVIIAPFAEEVIFRGFLYPILKKYTDRVFAALITSILFAIVHGNVPALVPLGVLAIGLCIAYEITGTIWVPILMHALFNGVMVAGMLLVEV